MSKQRSNSAWQRALGQMIAGKTDPVEIGKCIDLLAKHYHFDRSEAARWGSAFSTAYQLAKARLRKQGKLDPEQANEQ